MYEVSELLQAHFFYLMVFLLTALATLKPQAGLVAPQAVAASQPTSVVSYRLYNCAMSNIILRDKLLMSLS